MIGHSKKNNGIIDNQGAEIGELHWVRLLDFANPDFLLGEYSITGGTGIIRYAEGYLKDSIGPDGDGVLVSNFFLCGSGCDKGKERDKGKGKGSYPRFSFTDQQQQHQQVMGGGTSTLFLHPHSPHSHLHPGQTRVNTSHDFKKRAEKGLYNLI